MLAKQIRDNIKDVVRLMIELGVYTAATEPYYSLSTQ